MNHRRHLHLRNFLIFWNIYFTSSLVIPTDNGKHSTSTQFGRREISAIHLAIESSIDSKDAVSMLPTLLKPQTFPSTSSLRNSVISSASLGRGKITLLEGDPAPLLNPWGLRSDGQLEKFASTTSIDGNGKELDKLNSSWWKNQLPRILKSWWKKVINHLTSFQKSIKRGFGKIVPSRPYAVLSKSPSSHVISPSDRSTIHEGTKVLDDTIANEVTRFPHKSTDDPAIKTSLKSTADEGRNDPQKSAGGEATETPLDTIADQGKTTHEPKIDQATINHDELIANQATKIPHDHSHEDDEIFHDALSEFQDDEHETSLSTKPQPELKETHVPARADAVLKEKLSPDKAQGLPKANLHAGEQAASKENLSAEERFLLEENHTPAQAQAILKENLSPEKAQGLPKETPPAEGQGASKENLSTEKVALLHENYVPTKAQAALKEKFSLEDAPVVSKETIPAGKQAASKGPDALPATLSPVLAAPVSKSIADTPKLIPATAESLSNVPASSPLSAATKPSTRTDPISTAVHQVYRPTFRDQKILPEASKISKDDFLEQVQLAIAEMAWKLMQRGQHWNTVLADLWPGRTWGLANKAAEPLQRDTNEWKLAYDLEKTKSGVDYLPRYKTLREALDDPLDEATRNGYDLFMTHLKDRLGNKKVKSLASEDNMQKLRNNIAQKLSKWEENSTWKKSRNTP